MYFLHTLLLESFLSKRHRISVSILSFYDNSISHIFMFEISHLPFGITKDCIITIDKQVHLPFFFTQPVFSLYQTHKKQ